jgi:hypothetical protein
MANPQSQTRALPIFQIILKFVSKKDKIILQLGEVDCGFSLWIKSEIKNKDPQKELEYIIERYLSFITTIKNNGFQDILVSTVSPPTIRYYSDWGDDVSHARRLVSANIEQRTKITTNMNLQLKKLAVDSGYFFIDFYSELINDNTGLVDDLYLCENESEIHLNDEEVAKLIVTKLTKIMDHNDSR